MTLLLSWICGGCCCQCGAGRARGAAGCACTDPLICVVWGVHLRPSFTSIPSASKVQGMDLKHHASSKLTSNLERCQPWQAKTFSSLFWEPWHPEQPLTMMCEHLALIHTCQFVLTGSRWWKTEEDKRADEVGACTPHNEIHCSPARTRLGFVDCHMFFPGWIVT